MTPQHESIDDMLLVLEPTLGIAEVVLQREPHEPRILEIRERVAALRDLIVDHWADQAAREIEDDLQLRFEDEHPF